MTSTPIRRASTQEDASSNHAGVQDVPALASPLPEAQQPAPEPRLGIQVPLHADLARSGTGVGGLPLSSSSSRNKSNLLGSDGFGKLGAQLWAQREESVVRSRQGSVLNRGLILKTDHFAGGARHAHLNLHLQGAPNFRKLTAPSRSMVSPSLLLLDSRPFSPFSMPALQRMHTARKASILDSPVLGPLVLAPLPPLRHPLLCPHLL